MKVYLKHLLRNMPVIKSMLAERDAMLAEYDAGFQKLRLIPINEARLLHAAPFCNSVDNNPWDHPFLTAGNIRRFREYSDAVNSFAHNHVTARHFDKPLYCAFCINLAQNMYKWGKLAQKYGVKSELFMNPQDETALSQPCWEEFDGEYPDLLDGKGFLQSHPYVRPAIPCHAVPMDAEGLWDNLNKFSSGNRKPLLRQLANSPGIHHEPLMAYQGVHPFFAFARQLSKFDVTYCASIPIPAYMSGKPYCYFAVGGDLQWDCGRGDSYGEIMSLAVNAARFLMVSNPHALGHSRRLGFTNGVYLPYPMDSERYCPGQGKYRREWMTRFGGSVYILTTARLDNEVKGFDDHFFKVVVEIARKRPGVRFIFLAWGNRADVFKKGIAETDMERQLIVLMPAGKKRLIEYYRSCDIVLDQLVYGYFGATALEAASVGKPVVMKMRAEQYAPLYGGDVAPVVNLQTLHDFEHVLLSLIDSPERRTELGQAMRNWLVRNHGEETTVPRLLALLRFAAEQMQLPPEIARMNPLLDDETDEEGEYHHSCLREIVHD